MHKTKSILLGLLTVALVLAGATRVSAKTLEEIFPYTVDMTTGEFEGAKWVHHTVPNGLVAYCLDRWLGQPTTTGFQSPENPNSAYVVTQLDYIRKGKFDGSTTYDAWVFSPRMDNGFKKQEAFYKTTITPKEQLIYLTIARNGYPYKTSFTTPDETIELSKTDAKEATQLAMWSVPFPADFDETSGTRSDLENWRKQTDPEKRKLYKAAFYLFDNAMKNASKKILDELDAYLYVPNANSKVKMRGQYRKPQSYQRFFVIYPHAPKVEAGQVKLAKISSNENLTKDNKCYDLSNAYFHIYKGENFYNATDTGKWFKTGEQTDKWKHVVSVGYDVDNPQNDFITLEAGTYWVREEYSAKWGKPTTKSYQMPSEETGTVTGDANGRVSKAYKVVVKANQTVWVDDPSDDLNGFVTNKPLADPFAIKISKQDSKSGKSENANGAATLAGAEFTIRYYDNINGDTSGAPKRTWVIATNKSGRALLSNRYFVRGDEFYKASGANTPTIPAGTITIQETKAPKGYLLEGQTVNSPSDYQAPIRKRIITPNDAHNNISVVSETIIAEPVVAGGVAVQKLDGASSDKTQSTLGSFEGATFDVINENEADVLVRGKSYKKGEVVTILTTDSSGYAKTADDLLPYGKYSIVETKAPYGYEINSNKHMFEVKDNAQIVSVQVEDMPMLAGISVKKQDAETNDLQAGATFEGAEFAITNAQDRDVVVGGKAYKPGEVVTTITTNSDGIATTGANSLPFGKYTIKEVKAPKGYSLNKEWSETVELTEMGKTYEVECRDAIVRGGVEIYKYDADMLTNKSQGTSTLANCTFNLISNNETDIVVAGKTYKQGEVVATLTTNSEGYAKTADDLLPYGSYIVKEVKAPSGYLINSEDQQVKVTDAKAYARVIVTDNVERGGLSVIKRDAEAPKDHEDLKTTLSLAGARFEIVSENKNEVVVGGKTYSQGDVVLAIESDSQGVASTGDNALPLGTYSVREIQPPVEYTLNKDFKQTVTITKNGEVVDAGVCYDSSIKGELSIYKKDAYTHTSDNTGTAKLEGATFEIINASEAPVIVAGKVVEPGKVVATIVAGKSEDGVIARTGSILQFGTYKVKEIKAGAGYTVNTSWEHVFTIDKRGKSHDYAYDAVCENTVARVDWSFVKVSEDTKEPMAGVPFKITSTTTGESHIVVSDENGIVDTSAAHAKHTYKTNFNDTILKDDGWVDDELKDPAAGIWFTGNSDTDPDDNLGALPFDIYTVEELRSEANYGHALTGFVFTPTENEQKSDLGTVDNKVIKVGSELTSELTQDHIAPGAKEIGLTDKVTYTNLVAGTTYTLEGTLHVLDDTGKDLGLLKDADGSVYTVKRDFTPAASFGETEQKFTVDADVLKNKKVVAFEKIYEKGHELAKHADIADTMQTVAIPEISTLAHSEDGSHYVAAAANTKVIDTVTYKNLLPGKSYTLKAELYVQGETDPKDICTVSFVAEESTGTQDVVFIVDTTELQGKSAYLYETLEYNGCEIAWHKDSKDENQTVYFAKLTSELMSDTTGKTVPLHASAKLKDTLSYVNLDTNTEYKVVGTLHGRDADGNDLGVIVDSEGNAVTSEAVFTPEDHSGTCEVEFVFDSSKLDGNVVSVVAYQTLFKQNEVVVEHADINNEDQTVAVPRMTTELLSASDNSHKVERGKVKLIDTINYSGLQKGETYLIKSTLHLKSKDGTDAGIYNNQQVESTFVAEDAQGTTEVVFDVDTSDLDGDILVAFEEIYQGDVLICKECDIDNAAQSVTVAPKPHKPTAKTADNLTLFWSACLLSSIWVFFIWVIHLAVEHFHQIKQTVVSLLKR